MVLAHIRSLARLAFKPTFNMTQKNLFSFFNHPSSEGKVPSTNEIKMMHKQEAAIQAIKQENGLVQNIEPSSPKSIEPVHFSSDEIHWNDAHSEPPVPYSDLTAVFEAIEATTKRLLIHDILSDYFLRLMQQGLGHQLLYAIYLCLNRVGPIHEGLELGLGESLLIRAVAASSGRTTASVKADVERLGDLGSVISASQRSQKSMKQPTPLSIQNVYVRCREIASMTGPQSTTRKTDRVQSLLVNCTGNESKYLIRSLEGKLRIGLAEQSLLIGLAQAASIFATQQELDSCSPETAVSILKSVYSECPLYERIIPILLTKGIHSLTNYCAMMPGVPVKPMLAHPTKSLSEVLDRFEKLSFTCEYKYDGERAQVHLLPDGTMRVYSRNLENMSQKYPDIIEKMNLVLAASKNETPIESLVLDCEAVAYSPIDKKILPFQVLSTRKRKDVSTDNISVQIILFAFDLLYLNGCSLLTRSFQERRTLMTKQFSTVEGHFQFAKYLDSKSVEDIQTFLEESIKDNCEGLMVKTLIGESSYEPSKRSRNWLKVKKDYLSGIGDSLDLVVLGGYYGRGKRVGVYGGFLLGCYDDEGEVYQPICKIGTGFSEADLESLSATLKQSVIAHPKPYYDVAEGMKPDDWFDLTQVWEVKAADFSISPLYTAAKGKVDATKGISLRFPRFIRVRDDKTPEQATFASQVAELYDAQTSKKSKEFLDDDEDY